jgi:hypothetical protein
MRALIYTLTLLLLISCRQKTNNSTVESEVIENKSIVNASKLTESKIEFKSYFVDGILLKGNLRIFDNDTHFKEKLEVDKITLVQILEKSTKMYNVEGTTDNCEKAFFLKVKYLGNYYTVFGQDVYEINKQQKFSTQTEKHDKLTLFPITNFEMGASDDDGLTGCDDYSLLVLFNEKENLYRLMKYPNNEDIHGKSTNKFASLFHDDGSKEKIYKLTVIQDTLVIGIKAIYQEGGSVFNMKAILSGDFPETLLSDRVRFETDEELKQMDKIK